ncbi:MAG: methyltransferase domain-containing protein [Solidesulfovibrio sp. DCME]|uniref:methyltransferase domain-containing protein n=1 Tax=Solidesulfovibrio sp. DCME TaxID=3447380 RepID=UPI003D143D15
MPDTAPSLALVREKLAALGPGRVWRPVPGPGDELLARGGGPDAASLEAYVAGLDVAGKTVADLGCNLGFFSFLAARRGARYVLGCDIDPEVVAVARLLAGLHGLGNVAFASLDFLAKTPEAPCDLALFVDFIGRGCIAKGRLAAVAAAAEAWARHEAFFTLHPVYDLDDLPLDPERLEVLYPGAVGQGRFHTDLALAGLLGPGWARRRTTDGLDLGHGGQSKAAVLFTRLASPVAAAPLR